MKNMKNWLEELKQAPTKKPLPLLSFPSVQMLGITVKELVASSSLQAEGIRQVARRVDAGAAVSFMDLSVEAECFGSRIVVSDDEVPTVTGKIIETMEDAEALPVPAVGTARSGLCIEAIRQVCGTITDRPVFAGMIGPFSLAGRLLDVTEIMYLCYDEPELVEEVLSKVTDFLVEYAKAFKAAGANGVVVAEPLAGVLSPALAAEFSAPYVKRLVEQVQDDNFLLIYHNCGDNAYLMIDSILSTGASAYHFGNSTDMEKMLEKVPADTVVMGNIDPASQFLGGTPESITQATQQLLRKCGSYPNFVISSGCDIPPKASWENIEAFFSAAASFGE